MDYNFMGSPANIVLAIEQFASQGITDFCPAVDFDNSGNVLSTPPQDTNGNAYIRVRGVNLITPNSLTSVSASVIIPYCGKWMGES